MSTLELSAELLHYILVYVGDVDTKLRLLKPEERRRKHKKGLSACALTCRYWADRCRPFLYESLTLRSSDDWDYFRRIIKLRGPSVALAVRRLELEETDYPWAHCGFISLPSLVPALTTLRLTHTDGEASEKLWKGRPPQFANLLAVLPSRFQKLETLEFEEVYFPTFEKLVGCAGSFPELTTLTCKKVVWARRRADALPPVRAAWRLRSVGVFDCKPEQWPLTWLLLSSPRQSPRRPFADAHPNIADQDATAVNALLCMLYGSTSSCYGEIKTSGQGSSQGWQLSIRSKGESIATLTTTRMILTVVPAYYGHNISPRASPLASHLCEISIEVVLGYLPTVEDFIGYDWPSIDNLLDDLPEFQRISVKVDFFSTTYAGQGDTLKKTLPSLGLPRMSASKRLRLTVTVFPSGEEVGIDREAVTDDKTGLRGRNAAFGGKY